MITQIRTRQARFIGHSMRTKLEHLVTDGQTEVKRSRGRIE